MSGGGDSDEDVTESISEAVLTKSALKKSSSKSNEPVLYNNKKFN